MDIAKPLHLTYQPTSSSGGPQQRLEDLGMAMTEREEWRAEALNWAHVYYDFHDGDGQLRDFGGWDGEFLEALREFVADAVPYRIAMDAVEDFLNAERWQWEREWQRTAASAAAG